MTQNQYLPERIYIPHFGLEKAIVGVEIGVAGGGGSAALLSLMPNLSKLYCVDPWIHIDKEPFELGGYSQETHEAGYEATKKRLSEYPGRAVILRKTSDAALSDIPDGLDFVHIDGHHAYEQVLKDIKNYMKKIRTGGILSGHDFLQVPDVTRAIHEVFENTGTPVYLGNDFTWWVKI